MTTLTTLRGGRGSSSLVRMGDGELIRRFIHYHVLPQVQLALVHINTGSFLKSFIYNGGDHCPRTSIYSLTCLLVQRPFVDVEKKPTS